ncbi:Meiotic nuclear division protein 1 [Dipsacomyces acuminosporus]|nr:Meiotic nuclear division protein 1 [Dipsacomyces acuminosporus]
MPKAKKGRLSAALRQVQQAKARRDAAKRTQEHMENKLLNAGKSKGKGSKKQKQKRGPFFPYKKSDVILLVGEGNFSFASSIANTLGSGVNIVATAYDSREVVGQKYTSDAEKHISQFEALGGTALFEVDGTDLKSCKPLASRKFTHVVFNFPHAGAGIKDQARNIQTNQLLLIGFFRSAMSFLTVGSDAAVNTKASSKKSRSSKGGSRKKGSRDDSDDDDSGSDGDDDDDDDQDESFDFEGAQAHVSYVDSDDELVDGAAAEYALDGGSDSETSEFHPNVDRAGQIHVSLKSGLPYAHWNIRQLARECGLRGLATYPFDPRAFPGYEHRRTLGFKEGLSKDENQEIRDKEPKIYAFVVKEDAEDDAGEAFAGDGSIAGTKAYANKGQQKKLSGPRLTIDEKRKRMMEIFHESQEVFLLKELEKIGPKQKGIVAQTVKDVVQSLVDDGMCHMEKIGISNYFWSFPSEAAIKRRNKIKELEKEIAQMEAKQADLKGAIEKAQYGREQTDERLALTSELSEIEEKWNGQQAELQQFKECDPVLMNKKRQESAVAKDAANRWTDNIFIMQSWVRDKFNMETANFNKYFGIPSDFDNLS